MNGLETKARPFLEPMFHGDTVVLAPVAQRYMAAWIYKTVLTIERAHGESQILTPASTRASTNGSSRHRMHMCGWRRPEILSARATSSGSC